MFGSDYAGSTDTVYIRMVETRANNDGDDIIRKKLEASDNNGDHGDKLDKSPEQEEMRRRPEITTTCKVIKN